MQRFYEDVQPRKIEAVEYPFAVPLSDPNTGEKLDVSLVGVIDLIESDDEGNQFIAELKTSSKADSLAIGVDRIQRNFEPLRQQVEHWQSQQIADEQAKLVIYRALIQGDLSVPRALARDVHRNYFEPTHQDFAPRTMWSLSNAFTSALKSLDPIPFFQVTAKLGTFFQSDN